MKISRTSQLKSPFVISEDDITKLNEKIIEFAGNSSIQIECSDNLTREMNKIDELLEYDNPRNKSIKSLRLSAYGKERFENRRVYLTFSDSELSNIYLSIEGPEKEVTILNEKINDKLDGFKPWYAFMTRVDFLFVFLGLYFLLIAYTYLGVLVGFINTAHNTVEENSIKKDAIFFVIIVLPLVLSFILNWFRKKIFPISFFAMGQGKKRYKNLEKFRIVVVASFLLSILSGIFLKLFFN